MKYFKRYYWIVSLLFIGITLTSCSNDVKSVAELEKWVHQKENGLVCQKKINNVILTMTYLPPELLVGRELQRGGQYTPVMRDSLQKNYAHNLTFLLTIQPDAEKKASGDILYRGVTDYVSYKQRVNQLNFGMEPYIRLHTGTKTFSPALAAFENTYSLADHRSLYLVFSENTVDEGLFTGEKLDISFTDEFFDTGISHFVFDRTDLQDIPRIHSFD